MGLLNLKGSTYSKIGSARDLLLPSGKQHAANATSIASSSNPEPNIDATIKPMTGISNSGRTSETKRSND